MYQIEYFLRFFGAKVIKGKLVNLTSSDFLSFGWHIAGNHGKASRKSQWSVLFGE